MKKPLLVCLLASSVLPCKAQKIELGINGGIAPYVWADNTFKNYSGTTKNKPGYYGSLRVSLLIGGWQLGAGAEMFQTTVEAIYSTITPNDFKNVTRYRNFAPYLFVNKLFKLPKSFVYAGINGGINDGSSYAVISGLFNWTSRNNHSGYILGAQIGYTLNLVKKLGVNAELGAKYVDMENKVFRGKAPSYTHVIFPVSLGVRYAL